VADADAFLALAARAGLARSGAVTPEMDLASHTAVERLAALLVLRESRDPRACGQLEQFLRDPDSAVRFAAIQWVGEERLAEFRRPLEEALRAGPATSRLFGGYLAALERVAGTVRTPADEWGLDEYIVKALDDPATSSEVLRWSLRMLPADHKALSFVRIEQFIAGDDLPLRLEAVRSLRDSRHTQRGRMLARIAARDEYPLELRAEAIVGLAPFEPDQKALLLRLAQRPQPILRNEALRSLAGSAFTLDERRLLESLPGDDASRELAARVLRPDQPLERPAADDLAGWLKLLDTSAAAEGDPAAGERIFFHARLAGCSKCHQMLGRGARVGPELTATASRLARERLVESIVRPGKEIAPHFASWLVRTTSGKTITGVLVNELATGEQTYADAEGKFVELKPAEIEARKIQSTSIMPDGLARQLTVQEFRDLLAYLQSAAREAK
jgi:putative heme-binding domain-containing protein